MMHSWILYRFFNNVLFAVDKDVRSHFVFSFYR